MAFLMPQTTGRTIKNKQLSHTIDTCKPLKTTQVWTLCGCCMHASRLCVLPLMWVVCGVHRRERWGTYVPRDAWIAIVERCDSDLLTLKSVSYAPTPRSPVNNCGRVGREPESVLTVTVDRTQYYLTVGFERADIYDLWAITLTKGG